MKVLVTGAGGQLSRELVRLGLAAGLRLVGLTRAELDVTDPAAVRRAVAEGGYGLVVNAAAYTDVDRAETEPEKALAVNRDGPARLAAACARQGLPLVHVSTDYVFDGEKGAPYKETDPAHPVNEYGRSKAEGEAEVRRLLPEHLIVRTSWLCGPGGRNFVTTMLALARTQETLRVVTDQCGCPTYAADLARAILALARRLEEGRPGPFGTYHFCGRGRASRYNLALRTIALARRHESLKVKNVEPALTSEFPAPARRPADSTLDCSLFELTFGFGPPDWEDGLSRLIEAVYRKESR
ncbi:MAG: dTDP-4-dehydrorhamnose reductase [Thermodesulfobacteriota bacterium]